LHAKPNGSHAKSIGTCVPGGGILIKQRYSEISVKRLLGVARWPKLCYLIISSVGVTFWFAETFNQN
jgi:hypothetical protein